VGPRADLDAEAKNPLLMPGIELRSSSPQSFTLMTELPRLYLLPNTLFLLFLVFLVCDVTLPTTAYLLGWGSFSINASATIPTGVRGNMGNQPKYFSTSVLLSEDSEKVININSCFCSN
jgi:hypothetical protein